MTVKPDELMRTVVEAIEEKKGQRIVALHLTDISLVADYFVICHGNSDTQVGAIAAEIRKKAHEMGVAIRGVEGLDTGRWVLIDLGDVVIHIFHRDEREYYNLERLWSDAKLVEFA